jgi:hypothetical protein
MELVRNARRHGLVAGGALLALAASSAADVLTVGPAGSGAAFPTIQAAVDAAAADDVVLVRPGSYAGFVLAKPLRILGDGTGTVSVEASLVEDVGAGREVVVASLWLRMNPFTQALPLRVEDCAGTVVVNDVTVSGTDRLAGLRLERCARVVVLDSRILRAGLYGPTPGGAISAVDTELWLANVEATGNSDCCFATRASHAVELVNGALYVWRSRLRGGHSSSKQGFGQPADGGAGILAVNARVELYGGPGAFVTGGNGHDDFFSGESWPGGPGIELAQGSEARVAAGLPVSGGFDGLVTVQAPAIRTDATSTAVLDPKVFPTLVASTRSSALGSDLTLTLEGNPGARQLLFAALRTGPTTVHPKVDGLGLLDGAHLFLLTDQILPPAGTLAFPLHVPSTSALLGATLFFQNLERFPASPTQPTPGPGRELAFGNPVLVTIPR